MIEAMNDVVQGHRFLKQGSRNLMKKLTLALSALTMLTAPAFAQGDAEAGKTKAVVCSACHGMDGNSVVDMYPKIAGQHAGYIEKQLHDFKTAMTTGGQKGRMDPIMGGMVATLTDQDMADIAAFYATQTQTPAATPESSDLGQQLYNYGDAARGITACVACHGPQGKGMGAAGFPMVGGQHKTYIQGQLVKFRDGSRKNDMNNMMSDVAKKLSDDDMAALSSYITRDRKSVV